MKKLFTLLALLGVTFTAMADEGMWLLPYIKKMNSKDLKAHGAKIKAENIIYIASRDIDEGEAEIIRQYNIPVFHMHEIVAEGIDKTIRRIEKHLKNLVASKIYLSIDIDVIDPQLAPGTGVPVPNGIDRDMLFKFIDVIINTGRVKGAELVEVNPTLDDGNNTTTLLAIDIVDYLVRKILENSID